MIYQPTFSLQHSDMHFKKPHFALIKTWDYFSSWRLLTSIVIFAVFVADGEFLRKLMLGFHVCILKTAKVWDETSLPWRANNARSCHQVIAQCFIFQKAPGLKWISYKIPWRFSMTQFPQQYLKKKMWFLYHVEHPRCESAELTCADMLRLAALWGWPFTLCAWPIGGASGKMRKKIMKNNIHRSANVMSIKWNEQGTWHQRIHEN